MGELTTKPKKEIAIPSMPLAIQTHNDGQILFHPAPFVRQAIKIRVD